jgi:hypothetical protein
VIDLHLTLLLGLSLALIDPEDNNNYKRICHILQKPDGTLPLIIQKLVSQEQQRIRIRRISNLPLAHFSQKIRSLRVIIPATFCLGMPDFEMDTRLLKPIKERIKLALKVDKVAKYAHMPSLYF